MNDSILRDVCYLDTNIFVYLHDSNAADKQRVSAQLCAAFLPLRRNAPQPHMKTVQWRTEPNALTMPPPCSVRHILRDAVGHEGTPSGWRGTTPA